MREMQLVTGDRAACRDDGEFKGLAPECGQDSASSPAGGTLGLVWSD